MTELRLRPYQKAAITAIMSAWGRGVPGPAVVLPTGTGKTVIFSSLCSELARHGGRPLVLVHRDELLSQTVHKLESMAPHLDVGVIKAVRNTIGDVTVASVPTMGRESRLQQWKRNQFTHIIIDEAHHAAAKSYRQTLAHFPDAWRVGFSATLQRETGDLSEVWSEVVYRMDILPAIASGYLVDVRGRSVTVEDLSLGKPAKRTGDYTDTQLGESMIESTADVAIVASYKEHARRADGTYRPGICFAPTVAAATKFAESLNAAGITTECVFGTTPWDERAEIYDRVRRGETNILMSVMVLTEGFDLPEVEVAIIARPTRNRALYVQMVGRVLRPAPWSGKREALVLHVGADNLGLATLVDLTAGRPIREGQSVGEAETEGGPVDSERSGPAGKIAVSSTEVDMFSGSTSAWLQTPAGVWFIPTKDHFVFLWPEVPDKTGPTDLWKVGVTPTRGKGGEWRSRGDQIDIAMAWAEAFAYDLDSSISSRTSSWRKKKPSDKMLDLAVALGIDPAGLRAGELSDLITIALASRKFDKSRRAA